MGTYITRDGNRLYVADGVEAEGYASLIERALAVSAVEGCEDFQLEIQEAALDLESLLPAEADTDPATPPFSIPIPWESLGTWTSDEWEAEVGMWAQDPQLAELSAAQPGGVVLPAAMKDAFDALARGVLQLENGTCQPVTKYAGVIAATVAVPLLLGSLYYIWKGAT
ncbi:MAG: hypothetical protein ABFR47_09230 [Verrucomicrobiota bacterium]